MVIWLTSVKNHKIQANKFWTNSKQRSLGCLYLWLHRAFDSLYHRFIHEIVFTSIIEASNKHQTNFQIWTFRKNTSGWYLLKSNCSFQLAQHFQSTKIVSFIDILKIKIIQCKNIFKIKMHIYKCRISSATALLIPTLIFSREPLTSCSHCFKSAAIALWGSAAIYAPVQFNCYILL